MLIKNLFFKKKKYEYLYNILNFLGVDRIYKNIKINNITDLNVANKNDISFFNSLKYIDLLKNTKAGYVIVLKKHAKIVKKYCNPIIVSNVLIAVSQLTELFYPDSLNDSTDFSVNKPNKIKYKNIQFGKNVLLGKKVKIGRKTIIGHNTIIESNVIIGQNCIIGNNVLIKNSILGKNVRVLDGTIIGKKGFGFFPDKKKNIRYPHIGIVIINDNVEIGCNNTIDRGSLSNTFIGENTFIDNQVHIAHNVNIGKNSSANKIRNALIKFYKDNTFIKILKINSQIGSGNVLNTNNCEISVCNTRFKNRIVIFSAIDNLVKGASGQAVQNMNLIYNFKITLGLK